MIIRRAHTNDTAGLLALVAQYWEFEGIPGFQPSVVRAPLERLLASPDIGACWVATEAQQLLGYITIVYVFSLEHLGMTSEIDEFFVVPGYRTSGVGTQLIREAEEESVRQGCSNISLQISTSNHRAMAFYRRHGYSLRSAFELMEKALDVN